MPSLLLCCPATNRRELRAQTTVDACRIPFYFSVYPSVSLCPMRASSAACRRSPKRNTHPFARRFRRPASRRTGMYTSSETHSPSHALRPLRRMTCCLHQHSKRDGKRRPFCYAARQRTGANFARKPPLMRAASLFTFPYIRAFHYAPCAQVRRLADAHPKGTLTLSQDAFAALRLAERECTPRRKRTLLLTPSAHCGECLVTATKRNLKRTTLSAVVLGFSFCRLLATIPCVA